MGDTTYRLQYLTGRRLNVFLAAADTIIPPDEDTPGGGSIETAAVVDWAFRRLDPDLLALFLKFLLIVDLLGIFFGGRTFKNNSPEARARQFHWMENCPIAKLRMGFFGLKSYCCMGYYTREETWPTFGYEGPHVPERPFHDDTIRQLEQGQLNIAE